MIKMVRGDGFKYYKDIRIEGFHSAGRAYFHDKNRKIFLDQVMPGDIVDVKVAKRQKGYSIGELIELKQKSPVRINNFCKHALVCGGCNWQHIQYDAQLRFKKQILYDAFAKYEINVPELPDIVPSPETLNYRNKIEFAFGKDEKGKIIAGFHPSNKAYELFEIQECFLLLNNDAIALANAFANFIEIQQIPVFDFQTQKGLLKNLTIRATSTGNLAFIIGVHEENGFLITQIADFIKKSLPQVNSFAYATVDTNKRFFSETIHPVFGEKFLKEKIKDLEFDYSLASFFQPNPKQAAQLYDKIKEYAALDNNDFAYDLYTGAGTIACFLAKNAGNILGMEGSPDAIDDANRNARNIGLNNLEFICSDILLGFTKEYIDKNPKPKVIILDPPRSGTLIEIKKSIIYAQPDKIIYVSCNPVSLAWDLKQLCEFYRVEKIQAFDMFPHTHHVETVVLLELKH